MAKKRLLEIFGHVWLTTNTGQTEQSQMMNQNLVKHPVYMAVIKYDWMHIAQMNLLNLGFKLTNRQIHITDTGKGKR